MPRHAQTPENRRSLTAFLLLNRREFGRCLPLLHPVFDTVPKVLYGLLPIFQLLLASLLHIRVFLGFLFGRPELL